MAFTEQHEGTGTLSPFGVAHVGLEEAEAEEAQEEGCVRCPFAANLRSLSWAVSVRGAPRFLLGEASLGAGPQRWLRHFGLQAQSSFAPFPCLGTAVLGLRGADYFVARAWWESCSTKLRPGERHV